MKLNSFNCQSHYHIFFLYDPEYGEPEYQNLIIAQNIYQGFTLRCGHIELYTINGYDFADEGFDEGWSIDLEVLLDESVILSKDVVRAIQAPFQVTGTNGLIIEESVNPRIQLIIPQGNYSLVFEQGWKYNPQPVLYDDVTNEALPQTLYTLWGRLWFNHAENVEPKILFHDPRDTELKPSYPLSMDGVPI